MNGSTYHDNDAEWVEIIEPQSQQKMYANLETGDCSWDLPDRARLRPTNDRQWWELFDSRTNRYYYYNAKTKATVWKKPQVADTDIIPLAKLQGGVPSRESETQTSALPPPSSGRSTREPQRIAYAQDISPETGIVTVRSSPVPADPMSASFKAMSLDRRLEASTMGETNDFFPSHSPIEQSYDTPSTISRNRFPNDSSSPTRSVERRSLEDEGGEGWSKDAPKLPLSDPSSKTLKKEVGSLFKNIQSYMGDRKTKNNPDQLALSICEGATARVETADEACLLIVRQLTRNERGDSLRKGWELLAILLSLAQPTKKVAAQVQSFADRYSEKGTDPPGVPVSSIASQVLRKLNKTTARPRPSLSSVHEARVHIFHPPQFGATLDELMTMQKGRYPHLRIPWIESTLIDLVLNAGGSSLEGIFRVAADPEQIATAKARLDQWLVPAVSDAHVAACLLKAWLRELPEPLIPPSMYQRALDAGENPQEACHCAALLSCPSSLVLARLIRLLQTLAKEECVALTKMDASNLAMVVAPNVLRCQSDDPSVLMQNTRREMAFIRTLILHYDTTFSLET
ncbi:hypothetical protein PMAYCL1PPCAC_23145 [Pristionchus mayeri]|uniref:Rho GTPase-activating protein 39 n=1 Tax=Pristionchus mayeri TaxID=1317129 RepID=A0AAN5I6B7_9BILA|nr:hypothetical protein PMAYCL1PPCAC_23145 [Pristionchus mayeri]